MSTMIDSKTRIYWRFDRISRTEADNYRGWLAPEESVKFASMRNQRSRSSFVAGRRVAKQLLMRHWEEANAQDLILRSRNKLCQQVSPIIRYKGIEQRFSLSISHTSQLAAAAVCFDPAGRVGVDLVRVENRPHSFMQAWFTALERRRLDLECSERIACCWAAKEAAFKASKLVSKFAPLRFHVSVASRENPLDLHVQAGAERFEVRIDRFYDHVMAIATQMPTYPIAPTN